MLIIDKLQKILFILGTLRISRRELAEYCFAHPVKSFDSKHKYLAEYVKNKTGCPDSKSAQLNHQLSNFMTAFKTRYFGVQRKKKIVF